ncbi:MAG: hypothetical protein Q9160_006380 [Pyrenula sp. 1 TL-2023]
MPGVACGQRKFYSELSHSQSRNPLRYLATIDNPEIQTPSHRVHAFSHFDLTFDLHKRSQRLRLNLEPNHDILSNDAQVEFLDSAGQLRYSEPIVREEHKVYQGSSWVINRDGHWDQVGWARIVVRRDGIHPLFEGAFTIFGDHHHVQLASNYIQTKHVMDPELRDSEDEIMTVYRDSDISRQPHRTDLKRDIGQSCSSDRLPFNVDPNHPIYTQSLEKERGIWGSMSPASLFGKRQNQIDNSGSFGGNSGNINLKGSIGSTAGCPTTRKVALVGVATDCNYVQSFNSTDSMRQNVITQVNSASDLYQQTFNVTLGLKNLVVNDPSCPGTAPQSAPWNIPCGSPTITDRLNLFSTWRGERQDSNAYWSLFSTCNTGAEVGLAWLGQLCVTGTTNGSSETGGQSQTVTGANVVVRTSNEWQVFAHESGHTFGAVHDCDSQTLLWDAIPSIHVVYLTIRASRQSAGISAGTALSRTAKTVTVAVQKVVVTTLAAIRARASSNLAQYAMTVTKVAVRIASSLRRARYAEQAQVNATLQSLAPERTLRARLMRRQRMARLVAIISNALLVSVRVEINNARRLWGAILKGNCKGASFGGEVKSWIDDNKALVIGLACGIGGLLLLAILGCILRNIRNRKPAKRRKRHHRRPPQYVGGYGGDQGWDGPMPQMQSRNSVFSHQSHGAWQPPPPQSVYSGNGQPGMSGAISSAFRANPYAPSTTTKLPDRTAAGALNSNPPLFGMASAARHPPPPPPSQPPQHARDKERERLFDTGREGGRGNERERDRDYNPMNEISEEQRDEVNEALTKAPIQFTLFDLDHDGHLDYHELRVALRALGFQLPKPDLLSLLQQYGVPRPQSQHPHQKPPQQQPTPHPSHLLIPHPSFCHLAAQRILSRDPLEEIHRAFDLFDQDNKGFIDVEDLRRVARELGETGLEEEELRAMVEEFDLEGKGGVGRGEFEGICLG